ncbi:hypothetical protein J2X43_000071 [Rhizobium sp. BE258]|nr:hypothetical protein [Rhizobium sp. BE258]
MTDDWRARLRDKLEDFVDTFVVAGAKQEDVFDAIVEELKTLRSRLIATPIRPTTTAWRSRNLRTTGRLRTRANEGIMTGNPGRGRKSLTTQDREEIPHSPHWTAQVVRLRRRFRLLIGRPTIPASFVQTFGSSCVGSSGLQ